MITNLQALRALAAFSVLVYHTSFPLFSGNHTDFQGVAIFFVISGFIMTHITMKDNRESAPGSFFLHRVVRIVPLYWLCTLYYAASLWLRHVNSNWNFSQSPTGLFSSLSAFLGTDVVHHQLIELVKSLLFIPYINQQGNPHPLLAVGWTLNMEMHFYLCFALMLNFQKKLAPVLTFIMLIGFITFAKYSGNTLPILVLHAWGYSVYFCAGIIVYYLWRMSERIDFGKWSHVAVPISFLGILFYVAANLFPGQFPALIQICPVILVLAALVLHSCQWRIANRAILVLGAASYALYLTHTLVLGLQRVLARSFALLNFETSVVGFLVALLAALVVGIVVHLFLELPATRWLRRQQASFFTL